MPTKESILMEIKTAIIGSIIDQEGDFLLLEDDTNIILEDGSGFLLKESE